MWVVCQAEQQDSYFCIPKQRLSYLVGEEGDEDDQVPDEPKNRHCTVED